MFLLKWFVRDYENTKDPAVRSACSKLSGFVGIVCNLLLFAAKLVIGTVSGAVCNVQAIGQLLLRQPQGSPPFRDAGSQLFLIHCAPSFLCLQYAPAIRFCQQTNR